MISNQLIRQPVRRLSMQETFDHYEDLISRARDGSTDDDLVSIYKYFESIISAMPGNVYWLDHNCRIVGCNENVVKMFGVKSVDDLLGFDFHEMGKLGGWTQQQGESFEKDTREVLESGLGVRDIEEPPIPDANGRLIYFLTSRMPITDRQGSTIGVVGISIDITARKEAEEKLVEAKKQAEVASEAKSDFITNMQHDFRTPFNGIYSLANLMQEYEEDEEKKANLKAIAASAKQLLASCSEIITFSKSENVNWTQYHRKFDFKEIAEQVMLMERPAAMAKGLSLALDYDPSIPSVLKGDDFRLLRIMVNLISNAIKFTEKGHVFIRIARHSQPDQRHIVITMDIEDTGIGMTEDQQCFIFEKFSRTSRPMSNNSLGLGLGLGIVKNFIADMEGDIEVSSEPGRGTLFRCTFPFEVPLTKERLQPSNVASLIKRARDDDML